VVSGYPFVNPLSHFLASGMPLITVSFHLLITNFNLNLSGEFK
jgi:hypothetical protein